MFPTNTFSFHIDLLGIFRLGSSNEEKICNFKDIIYNEFINRKATVLIPTYSYSYTSREPYNIKESSSKVGFVTESIRKSFLLSRTADPIFSYCVFGDGISKSNFLVKDHDCFGSDSLMSEMYQKNAMICSIGAPWHRVFTEVHFVEKMLEMKYRKDKKFYGKTIDHDGASHETCVTFYCRDYNYSLSSEHGRLAKDLIDDGIMKTFNVGNTFQFTGVLFNELYEYISHKVKKDYFYLCKES